MRKKHPNQLELNFEPKVTDWGAVAASAYRSGHIPLADLAYIKSWINRNLEEAALASTLIWRPGLMSGSPRLNARITNLRVPTDD